MSTVVQVISDTLSVRICSNSDLFYLLMPLVLSIRVSPSHLRWLCSPRSATRPSSPPRLVHTYLFLFGHILFEFRHCFRNVITNVIVKRSLGIWRFMNFNTIKMGKFLLNYHLQLATSQLRWWIHIWEDILELLMSFENLPSIFVNSCF